MGSPDPAHPRAPPWARTGDQEAGARRLRTDVADANAGAPGSRVGTPARAPTLGLREPHRAHLDIMTSEGSVDPRRDAGELTQARAA